MALTTIEQAQPGQMLRERAVHLSREDLVMYANASGDQNPIHQDEAFARSVGLPDVIAHGMLTFGIVASAFEEVAGGADRVLELGTRFASPVVVPAGAAAEITVQVTLKSRDDEARRAVLEAVVSVAGVKVLNRTRATIALN